MATATDKARDHGIPILNRGSDYRCPCPKCSPTRKKKKDPCLHVSIGRGEIKACCHHCGWGVICSDDQGSSYRANPGYRAARPAPMKPKAARGW